MTPQNQVTNVIRCNTNNAAQFQRIVKQTPALLDLVTHLQQQGLFPGLRAMAITITGAPATVAKGLDAWDEIYRSSSQPG